MKLKFPVYVVGAAVCALSLVGFYLIFRNEEPSDDTGYTLVQLGLCALLLGNIWTSRARRQAAEVEARLRGRLELLAAMAEAQQRGMAFSDFLTMEMERDAAYAKTRGLDLDVTFTKYDGYEEDT